ncbi:TatD family hydrolase [Cerasicoccus fimbriatus]|uniref:TatD family hydrolase n=1 Tax=Cerasicoccus fimbriatus TaxID=3014554 RepID=UPI0022B32652|nr:TatD family hydrolase [Cerasicoccus sp. TK19100]
MRKNRVLPLREIIIVPQPRRPFNAAMDLIDSHCHFEKFHQRGQVGAIIARAAELGVNRFINIGTSMDDWALYRDLARKHLGKLFWTAGLHPCHVEEDWRDHVTALSTYWTDDPAPVALGEIGLDNFHLPKYPDEAAEVKKRQADAFRAQLDMAFQFDAPIVVHSRNAFDETMAILEEKQFPGEKVVFHCFAEGPEEMKRLYAYGGRASFTGIVTYKSAENVRQAVIEQGIERIMVETDAPYLAPVPHRGKECEPGYTRYTAEKCAELLGLSLEDFATRATANTEAFFGLK